MRRTLLMPKLGLTMTEGLLLEWALTTGQTFAEGQTLFVVETEKTTNDIGAETAGMLLDIVQPAGATVPVGEVVGYFDDRVAQAPGSAARS
jgi:pyruvate dehydrogenase E2 component (dihydrolipoamide acetyltransferase)